MAVIADTDEDLERGRNMMRPRLAFYGSTPAYKVILDVHGWGDLQPELNRLSKQGAWAEMTRIIRGVWGAREDRYSEKRMVMRSRADAAPKVEMNYIGG